MFTDSFYPAVDGAIVAMERAADALEARGHEIIVLAPDAKERVRSKRTVYYLPAREFRKYPGYRIVFSPGDMLERLRKEKVEIIHSHGLASMGILSLTASRALRLPHVLTFHTMANEAMRYYSPLPIREDIMEKLVWMYLRNLLKRPHVVIAPTAPIRDELVANGVVMRHCEVLPTGVDCSLFSPERYDKRFLERYGLAGKKVLLHVGRLSKEKRLDEVLRAVAQLAPKHPDLRLLVVGRGPAAEEYKAMTRSLGISDRVVFAGFLPDEELPTAYASCDALVIASTFETQGLVVLEALASGLPVVGIRCRAIPEFVQEGKNGCLFDSGGCADAIERCLARASSMRLSAVSSAREYSIGACVERLEKIYKKAEELHAAEK